MVPEESSVVAQRRAQRDALRNALRHHFFMPYSDKEIRCLCDVIAKFVDGGDQCPRFDGLTWVFVRHDSDAVDQLVDWTSSCPDTAMDPLSLMSHWISTDVPAHDAAGIFGFSQKCNENRLLSLGAILKRDMDAMMSIKEIVEAISHEDENRTGYTSAVYMAYRSDAVVLKVSATDRSVKLMHGDFFGGEPVAVDCLYEKLQQLLGSFNPPAPERPCKAPDSSMHRHDTGASSAPAAPVSRSSSERVVIEHAAGASPDSASAPLEERILIALRQAQRPLTALEVSKEVGLTTQKEVNPTLHLMLKDNQVQKESDGQSKPLWSLGTVS